MVQQRLATHRRGVLIVADWFFVALSLLAAGFFFTNCPCCGFLCPHCANPPPPTVDITLAGFTDGGGCPAPYVPQLCNYAVMNGTYTLTADTDPCKFIGVTVPGNRCGNNNGVDAELIRQGTKTILRVYVYYGGLNLQHQFDHTVFDNASIQACTGGPIAGTRTGGLNNPAACGYAQWITATCSITLP